MLGRIEDRSLHEPMDPGHRMVVLEVFAIAAAVLFDSRDHFVVDQTSFDYLNRDEELVEVLRNTVTYSYKPEEVVAVAVVVVVDQ